MGGGYLSNPIKKKAYTLVELIGVLAVLSIMLIVIVPAILNTIKTNDKNKYKNFERIVLQAAEVYVENNRELYPYINTKGKAVVRVSYIINDGYLKSNLVDPSTKKSINPNTYITVLKNSDETLSYTYGGSDCELAPCPECDEPTGQATSEDVKEGVTFWNANTGKEETGVMLETNDIIPENLTSNNDSRGYIITGNFKDQSKVYQLFNVSGGDAWATPGQYLILELPKAIAFRFITFQAWYTTSYSVYGSKNGNDFSLIKSFKVKVNNGDYRARDLQNVEKYKYYKIVIDKIENYNGNYGVTTGVHFIHFR